MGLDAAWKLFLGGLGVWALKAYIQKASITPKASTGFLSLSELQAHCERVQGHCVEKLMLKVDSLESSVSARFNEGTKALEDHEQRLRDIQVELSSTVGELRNFQLNHAAEIAAEIVKKLHQDGG